MILAITNARSIRNPNERIRYYIGFTKKIRGFGFMIDTDNLKGGYYYHQLHISIKILYFTAWINVYKKADKIL